MARIDAAVHELELLVAEVRRRIAPVSVLTFYVAAVGPPTTVRRRLGATTVLPVATYPYVRPHLAVGQAVDVLVVGDQPLRILGPST